VFEEARAKAPALLPDKRSSIITYSTNVACGRGEALAEQLNQLGYTNVRVYRGGIEDWVAAGLPIEADTPAGDTRSESPSPPPARAP
jgi:rhodanese-related sulfurtransferase